MAWKNGIVNRARKAGAAFVSVTESLLGEMTLTPEMLEAFPSITACAPATTSRNGEPCDAIFGFASRSHEFLKLWAVTAWPFENLKPDLIVKVYVLPLFETSGWPAAT